MISELLEQLGVYLKTVEECLDSGSGHLRSADIRLKYAGKTAGVPYYDADVSIVFVPAIPAEFVRFEVNTQGVT